MNAKRVWRRWKRAGWSLPRKRPPRRHPGPAVALPQRAERPNHVWPYDFLFDRTEAGQLVKILIVLDEDTRARLAIRVEKRLGAEEVMETLEPLFGPRGAAAYRRSDHGPECIAQSLQAWLGARATRTGYIPPGHPWENGYAASFIGKLRDACLNEEVFRSVEEARGVIECWRREYNQRRPHSALGYRTPAERPVNAEGGSLPVCSAMTQSGSEASQGHRLNILMDQF